MKRKALCWWMAAMMGMLPALAEATTWTKVRYHGGPVETKVGPKDWNNRFTVTPDSIVFALKDGQMVVLSPKWVTALTYGQEAGGQAGGTGAVGVRVGPITLSGLRGKPQPHYIAIEYAKVDSAGADSTRGGLLIQAADQNYRQILSGLKTATGKPVQANAAEAKYVNP